MQVRSRASAYKILALYGFRTVLECAGKAVRPNRTSAIGDRNLDAGFHARRGDGAFPSPQGLVWDR